MNNRAMVYEKRAEARSKIGWDALAPLLKQGANKRGLLGHVQGANRREALRMQWDPMSIAGVNGRWEDKAMTLPEFESQQVISFSQCAYALFANGFIQNADLCLIAKGIYMAIGLLLFAPGFSQGAMSPIKSFSVARFSGLTIGGFSHV